MKKINLFLTILAAAAGFTNCAKVDLVENKEAGNGGTVVYATTDAVTKTTLANDYNVLWSTGDQIKFVKDDIYIHPLRGRGHHKWYIYGGYPC